MTVVKVKPVRLRLQTRNPIAPSSANHKLRQLWVVHHFDGHLCCPIVALTDGLIRSTHVLEHFAA